MLRFIYRWRYRRAQKAGAFKLPPVHRGEGQRTVDLASYLSQTSVRGRDFNRFDLPRKRRRSLSFIIVVLLALLIAWITLESIAALELFQN
jgi:hypothetical protein